MNATGSTVCFRSLDRLSLTGSRFNEDGAGLRGRFAWIIDGATGLSEEQLTSGGSDAAWLADFMDERLAALSEAEAADGLLQRLEADVRSAFGQETAHVPDVSDHHTPSACLGLIEVIPGEGGLLALQGRFLGDVIALVPSEHGIVRWSDERAKPFERKTMAALGAREHEPGKIPEAVRRQIRENRTRLNQPDGYWVVSPRRPWAGEELRFEAQVQPGAPIVLATDGFMRLVDVFGAYSDGELYHRLAQAKGPDLMQELRDRERGDLMAGAYPRVKTHDDATFLVIAAERSR
ncbi:protein phosphatase 2C domain-containing protein [Microvirga sp. BT688]|uniref:protein phosphatase 2C domain-containing protein n=1 Tax=Microvirga sp. TaxID=1873136 RepID=UPI0016881708|nr:protein phosphatase 2C domain-containing protein [Microvirga sp.]MBD2746489.1 protein phosphatase 2C domain-containing protein [Microvirga sp.]